MIPHANAKYILVSIERQFIDIDDKCYLKNTQNVTQMKGD